MPTYHIEDHPTTYEIVMQGSRQNRMKLIDSGGYGYTLRVGGRKNGRSWRCSVRSKTLICLASVIEINGTFTPGPRDHCHPCDPGLLVNTKLKVRVKKDAQANLHTAAGALIESAWIDIVTQKDHCLQSRESLERIVSRARTRATGQRRK